MKFGVVMFPGSNCDRDMIDALQNDLGQEVITLWHKDSDINNFTNDDCIVLPGGFSYGDYLRCGAIARFSPMMVVKYWVFATGFKFCACPLAEVYKTLKHIFSNPLLIWRQLVGLYVPMFLP